MTHALVSVLALFAALLGAPSVSLATAAAQEVVMLDAHVAGGGVSAAESRGAIGEDVVTTILLIGLVGVGAVAATGTALLAIGRRRRTTAAARAKLERAADPAGVMERRMLRRARQRWPADPIDDDQPDAR